MLLRPFRFEPHPRLVYDERGSVTYIFLLLIGGLIGGMSLSFMIGNHVAEQVKIQHAADASAIGAAAHAAQGLNMIAVNNQAIAASLQINHSLLLLAHYHVMIEALASTTADLQEDVNPLILQNPLNSRYQKVFDLYEKPARVYMKTALGAAKFNERIRQYWLAMAPLRALEQGRLNMPGAVIVPKQSGRLPFRMASYPGLMQANPKETICTVTATKPTSGGDLQRDNFLAWLQGPLLANQLGRDDPTEYLTHLNTALDKIHKLLPLRIGFTTCGIALKSPLFAFFDKNSIYKFIGLEGNIGSRAALALNLQNKFDGYVDWAVDPCDISLPFSPESVKSLIRGAMTQQRIGGFSESNMFTSAMLKNLHDQHGNTYVYYAEGTIKVCEDDLKSTDLSSYQGPCQDKYLIDADSFVCPLWEKIEQQFKAGTCLNTHRHRPPTTENPKRRFQKRFKSHCAAYAKWTSKSKPHLANLHDNEDPPSLMIRNLGSMAHAFKDRTSDKGGMGFTVIKNMESYPSFSRGLVFHSMLYMPTLDGESTRQNWSEVCSKLAYERLAQPTLEGQAKKHCQIDTSPLMTLVEPSDELKASDDYGQLMTGGSHASKDTKIWSRSRWALSSAGARYLQLSSAEPALFGQLKTMQVFWPGWGVTLRQSKAQEFMGETPISKTMDWIRGR